MTTNRSIKAPTKIMDGLTDNDVKGSCSVIIKNVKTNRRNKLYT